MIRTAECVSPMHPDKMCDRISDTLLDLYLKQQLEKQELIKQGYKEEVSKWNRKYKDLKKQILDKDD